MSKVPSWGHTFWLFDFFIDKYLDSMYLWPLFLFIFVFSTCYNLNWKKHRCCAWDSNPGGRMKGANESTELRRHPKGMKVSQGMQWSLVKYMMHQVSITGRLTSCLIGFDLTNQVKLLFIQLKQTSWIQAK